MFKTLKTLFWGILIGGVVGLWFGVNIGKDKHILSNPFAERTLTETLKDTGKDMGALLEKGGKTIQENLK